MAISHGRSQLGIEGLDSKDKEFDSKTKIQST